MCQTRSQARFGLGVAASSWTMGSLDGGAWEHGGDESGGFGGGVPIDVFWQDLTSISESISPPFDSSSDISHSPSIHPFFYTSPLLIIHLFCGLACLLIFHLPPSELQSHLLM